MSYKPRRHLTILTWKNLCFTGFQEEIPREKSASNSKPNPIPNLTVTLRLTSYGGFFLGGFFPDTALLNSVQKFIEKQGWLLLMFFICLHSQLSPFNSIILQMPEKRVHQIDHKNEWLLLSVTFTAKHELVFVLTLFRMGRGRGPKRSPCQFFPCNFYKHRNQPSKLSDFQFYPFCRTGVKFQVCTQFQSQIIELESRPPLKKSGFSGQILVKLRL